SLFSQATFGGGVEAQAASAQQRPAAAAFEAAAAKNEVRIREVLQIVLSKSTSWPPRRGQSTGRSRSGERPGRDGENPGKTLEKSGFFTN
ncbi:MAG: hypothetical protein AAGJ73_16055, partial [Pseudomonadota bacterium]